MITLEREQDACISVTGSVHTNLSLESCPYFIESCSGKSTFISISHEPSEALRVGTVIQGVSVQVSEQREEEHLMNPVDSRGGSVGRIQAAEGFNDTRMKSDVTMR